jgi:hypothetical protein
MSEYIENLKLTEIVTGDKFLIKETDFQNRFPKSIS